MAARELGYHLPWTKEQKRKPEREADRCFLPYAYKPVLCIASARD